MLSTALSILFLLFKIIGILLLIIISLILLILLIPIRYEFDFSKKENSEVCILADAGWFFFLVKAKASYIKGGLTYSFRIAGKELAGSSQKTRKKEKKSKSKTENENMVEELLLEKIETEIEKEIESTETEEDQAKPGGLVDTEYNPRRIPTKFEDDSGKDQKKKKRKKDKKKTEEKKAFSDRIEDVKGKIDKFLSFADEYQIKNLLVLAQKTILKILKGLMPKKIQGWLKFGFEDPSLTGRITAQMAIFYPVYGRSFSLQPDFHQRCIKGDCKGKGHIRLGFFLWILISLLLKKEIRKVIRFIIK